MINFTNNLRDKLAVIYYQLNPKIYGRGYERYKRNIIKRIVNKEEPKQVSFLDERIVEIPWIVSELKKIKGNLLDAGSTLNQYYILKLIKHFNKIFITTLYPEENYHNNLNVSYTYEDLANLSFKNEYFDVVTSISTLEHINYNNSIYNYGKFRYSKKKQKNKLFTVLENLNRVLKKKGTLLITIPYGKKGIYNNMQQFDKVDLDKIIKFLKPTKYSIKYYVVKDKKWSESKSHKCLNVDPNIIKNNKLNTVLSANSVALIKIIK
tara:strand:+ start:77 stop:871 length:795 start_codon:yes stop_codon:yes gene_type:complete